MNGRFSLLVQAIAEVIGTFDGVEELSAGLREDIVIIFKGSIGYGKSLLFQLLPRQHTTFTSCQNAACFNDFSPPAGRLRLSKCVLFLPLVSY